MNCSEIRDLLMTDYADGEVDAETGGDVRRHLERCAACAGFREAVSAAVVAPVRGAPRREVPPAVWERVRREAGKKRMAALREAIRDRWRRSTRLRRAAFAGAAAAAAAVVAALLVRPPDFSSAPADDPAVAYIREQYTALAYLGENGGTDAAGDERDRFGAASLEFGTLVEEYLL